MKRKSDIILYQIITVEFQIITRLRSDGYWTSRNLKNFAGLKTTEYVYRGFPGGF